MNDKTRIREQEVLVEQRPRILHLLRLFAYVFKSTKGISCIYLGLFLLLSAMRPLVALLWGRYIVTAENILSLGNILHAVFLLFVYFVIGFAADLIESYMAIDGGGDLEQLDLVQSNRQRELLQTRLLKKLSVLSPEYFEVPRIQDRIEQVFEFTTDSWGGLNRKVMLSSYVIIAKCVSLVSIAATLYLYHPALCFIVLIAPLPTLLNTTIGEKLEFRFLKQSTQERRALDYYQKLMLSSSAKEMKIFGLYDFFYDKWKVNADQHTLKQQRLIRNQTILQTLNTLVMNMTNILGIILAVLLMSKGKLSLSGLSVIFALIGTLSSDASHLISSLASFLAKKNNAAQFFDLMDLPEQDLSSQSSEEFFSLEARDVKYRYPLTQRYVINGVSVILHKGEKVAFVGANGAGKTTFVKLITGLLLPSEGELLFNGKPVECLSLGTRYNAQSVVVQSPTHYETFTVRENVYLGDTLQKYDQAAVDSALEFVDMNHVNDDILGKDIGGTDLSGGQWQKLAIARAMYRNRDLIVLDEPTSNLDPLAEAEIFRKYLKLAENKTVVFVTHRISAASLADRIIVFKDGVICEDGTHNTLLAQEGEYARMYNEQAKWYNR